MCWLYDDVLNLYARGSRNRIFVNSELSFVFDWPVLMRDDAVFEVAVLLRCAVGFTSRCWQAVVWFWWSWTQRSSAPRRQTGNWRVTFVVDSVAVFRQHPSLAVVNQKSCPTYWVPCCNRPHALASCCCSYLSVKSFILPLDVRGWCLVPHGRR
jgi:hypothetical protein